jgi:hypothetical protein
MAGVLGMTLNCPQHERHKEVFFYRIRYSAFIPAHSLPLNEAYD